MAKTSSKISIKQHIFDIFHSICSILFIVLTLAGCETEIDVDLPEYSPKIVIEGMIENGQPARVVLSRSIPYLATIDINYIWEQVIITGDSAQVFLTTDAGETEQLQYQYCYESPLYMAFVSQNIKGEENMGYTLTVRFRGETYTAHTTIPNTFDLDSIGFDHSSELLNDSMASIRLLLTDDGSKENYYAFSCKVQCPTLHDRLWVSTIPNAFDDQTFNGLTFNYEITRAGVSTFMMQDMSVEELRDFTRLTFRPGDTVFVRHSLMDYDSYRFMITGGTEAIFGTNPFTNPAPVVSNIQGKNVLGAWCGYASKIDTLIWHR